MNSKYEKYLDKTDPKNPVFEATRIDRYCVFTTNVLMASAVAVQLNARLTAGKTIKPRGAVTIKGQEVEYTMIASDIEL
jgi:uncharacterized protein (UPF0254 family)